MKAFTNLRKLYIPIQPTIKQSEDHISYQEFLPSLNLQDYIYCYWQLKTTKTLTQQFNYRVVADGCIDIYFELKNPTDSFVMGFCKKYTEFALESSFNYVGVRFLPTMFPQIFNINASILSNRFEKLINIIPKTSNFISSQFNETQTIEDIKVIFDTYFIKLLAQINFNFDNRLYEAIKIILLNYGVVNIKNDLNTGISPRQLQRLFSYYIGDTAKTFCKVVQFQNILRAKPSNQSLKQNKLFYDIGYYDQAHFIKDFKNFYGTTPSKAFKR